MPWKMHLEQFSSGSAWMIEPFSTCKWRARGKQHIPATPLKPTLNRESYSWQIERRQIAWKAILCVKRMAANTVIMRVLGR